MKKTIPIMVAATVVCAMFAMMFVTTDVDATDAGLYLNGDLVSGTSSGEGWSYNADTKTLTLSGANFTTAHNETGMYTMSAPLYYGNEETLTIQLTGNNSITGVGTADENCGIFVRGSLVISGSGSLTVSNASYNEAIMAVNHIMISGGTITSASGPGQFDLHVADTDAEDGFLMTGGSLHLSGSGNMDVNGGAGIKITGGLIESDGGILAAIGGPGVNGPFEISGGKVIVHNATADGLVAFGSDNGGSVPPLAIHDAPLSNVVQSGNSLKAIAAGDASIGWESVTKIVTFNANGGTCGTASAETGADGKLTSLPTATRDGYAFDGWFTAAESGDKITTDTVFDADATVYAHWTADTPSGDDGKKENNIGLIIGGIVVGVVVIAAVAFFLIRKH